MRRSAALHLLLLLLDALEAHQRAPPREIPGLPSKTSWEATQPGVSTKARADEERDIREDILLRQHDTAHAQTPPSRAG